MALITQQLRAVLTLDPASNAIEYHEQWFSWGQLAGVIGEIETELTRLGLPAEARVGVMLRNRPGPLAAAAAILATDRCLVSLNPVLPDERLAADLAGVALPVIIAEESDLARPGIEAALAAAGTAAIALTRALGGAALVPGHDVLTPGPRQLAPGVAIEMLTSGTTGTPKRVPLTRAAFDASFTGVTRYEKGRDFAADKPALRGGIQIVVNPMTHIGGIYGALAALMAGRRVCLLERFTVEGWHDAVKRHRPKVIGAVPTALKMLLEAKLPREDLASLAAVLSGTAPLEPGVVDEFLAQYGIPILSNYGATEFAGAIAGWSIEDFRAHWARKRGAAGRLHAGIEARIIEPETGDILPPGYEGILELRGAQLGNPGAWLRTTDRAVLDADKFLFIKGRADNAIIRGGFKVHPDEVVRVLEQHPAIREAVVVGIPDARLGQVPAAALVLRAGAPAPAPAELAAFARARLLPYQVPVVYKITDTLPRTASMKPALVQIAALFSPADALA